MRAQPTIEELQLQLAVIKQSLIGIRADIKPLTPTPRMPIERECVIALQDAIDAVGKAGATMASVVETHDAVKARQTNGE